MSPPFADMLFETHEITPWKKTMKNKYYYLPLVIISLVASTAYGYQNPRSEESFPLYRSTPMSARLFVEDNRIFTYVSVNGSEERLFVVDNAWSHTTIDPRLLSLQNLDVERNVGFRALGQRGLVAPEGTIHSLRLGNFEIQSAYVRSSDVLEKISQAFNRDVSGVFAHGSMAQYVTTIDIRGGKISFHDCNGEHPGSEHGYNAAIVLDFGLDPWGNSNKQHFSIELTVNGKVIDAVVDLGFQGGILTNLDPEFLELCIDPEQEPFGVYLGGIAGRAWNAELCSVEVSGVKVNNVETILFEGNCDGERTLVGVEFLKKFKMIFDFRNEKLALIPYLSPLDETSTTFALLAESGVSAFSEVR